MLRVAIAFVMSLVVGAVLVTVVGTQVNLAAIGSVGADVDLGTRIDATLADLGSFAPLLAIILILAYGIAFPVARLIIGMIGGWRTFGYSLGGFVAVVVTMVAISAWYELTLQSGITAVPASRGLTGLALLGLGGAGGGFAFAALSKRS